MKQSENYFWAIVYVSSAMKGLVPSTVEYYIAEGRKVRKEKAITGITILAKENILVVLEGQKENVKGYFEEEKKHPAQHSLIKLYDGPISSLYFEDHTLAFKSIGNPELKYLDDFSNPEQKEYLEELLQMDEPVAKIVRDFIKNNG